MKIQINLVLGKPLFGALHKMLLSPTVELSPLIQSVEELTESNVDCKNVAVISPIPLHIASRAASVTEIALDLPVELRGRELTENEIVIFWRESKTYFIQQID